MKVLCCAHSESWFGSTLAHVLSKEERNLPAQKCLNSGKFSLSRAHPWHSPSGTCTASNWCCDSSHHTRGWPCTPLHPEYSQHTQLTTNLPWFPGKQHHLTHQEIISPLTSPTASPAWMSLSKQACPSGREEVLSLFQFLPLLKNLFSACQALLPSRDEFHEQEAGKQWESPGKVLPMACRALLDTKFHPEFPEFPSWLSKCIPVNKSGAFI